MKNLKMNSRSNSSGQVLVILIILVALLGAGFWWLTSNKQAMAKEGREFGRETIQSLVVQHDLNFFGSRLSPEARRLGQSTCRETFNFSLTFLSREAISMHA